MAAVFQGLTCIPALCFAIDDDIEVIGRLRDAWESQASEILTADITYLSFFRPPKAEITEGKLRELLEAHDIREREQFDALARIIDPSLRRDAPAFSVSRMAVDGDSVFNEDVFEEWARAAVQHGETEVQRSIDGKQVDILFRGRSQRKRMALRDLRFLPRPDRLGGFIISGERPPDGGAIVLARSDAYAGSNCSSLLVADRESGLVLESRDSCEFTASSFNDITKLTIQQPFAGTQANVVFPASRITSEFKDGVLESISMYCIESAVFNKPVVPSTFLMPAEKGAVVVDRRFDAKKPSVFKAVETAADAIELANNSKLAESGPAPAASRTALVVLCSISVLLVLTALYCKRWR